MEISKNIAVLILALGGAWYCARRKGYNPWLWFLGGTLNLLVLAFLPFTNRNVPPTEADGKNRAMGNWVGLGLTILGNLVQVVLLVSLTH